MASGPVSAAPAEAGRRGEGGDLRRRQVLAAFSGLMLGMLLAALDQTMLATALPTIAGDLGGLDQIGWVVTAYMLAIAVVMPVYGKVGDLLGRKAVFQFAIVAFLVGSALCGLAETMGQLIAFRAFQGVGGGGLMIGAQAIIGDIVSPRERGRYQGLMGGVFAVASVVGPLLGGFFVDHLSWRWVFYVNLPVGVVALAVIAAVLKLPRTRARPDIDYLGAVLLGGAATCLVLLTSWGGTRYGWESAPIIGLATGTVALVAAWLTAARRTSEPIVPLRLFRDSVFSVASAVSFLVSGAAMFSVIAFLPTFLQIVTGAAATDSGLLMLPMMAGILVSTVGSGQLISRSGRYKAFPVAGTAVAGVGLVLLSAMDADSTRTAASLAMLVVGLGIGMVTQVMVLAVQNSVPARDMGTATSSVSFLRTIGGSVGVAVVGALFTHRLTDNLAGTLPPAAAARIGGDIGSLTPATVEQLPPNVQHQVVAAFADALAPVFGFMAPALLLAFVLALLLKEKPLRTTAHVGNSDSDAPRR